MSERIETLIDALLDKREGLLEKYISTLEEYAKTEAGAQPSGLDAVTAAGLIHDIDKHLTNLRMELRLKGVINSGVISNG